MKIHDLPIGLLAVVAAAMAGRNAAREVLSPAQDSDAVAHHAVTVRRAAVHDQSARLDVGRAGSANSRDAEGNPKSVAFPGIRR
ncbi:MAG: hypothetical protein U0163_17515 [Gemmatimonadaceae bacterium]